MGQVSHSAEVAGPLGDADGAAGVEHVESVAALEHVVVGGHDQPSLQGRLSLRLEDAIEVGQAADIGHLEVVGAVFHFLPVEDVAVGDTLIPADIQEGRLALQEEHDTL